MSRASRQGVRFALRRRVRRATHPRLAPMIPEILMPMHTARCADRPMSEAEWRARGGAAAERPVRETDKTVSNHEA